MSVCGIDVSEDRVYPVALHRVTKRFEFPQSALEPRAGARWVLDRHPTSVAIDSPPRPNSGLLKDAAYLRRHGIDLRGGGTDRRVAEWRFGIGGCYSTRASVAECQRWMRTGMQLYAELERAGLVLDLGAGGTLFEVHPTYGFRSLVGLRVNGLRVTCDPDGLLRTKLPVGSVGHEQRLELLRLLCGRWGVEVHPRARESLDWADAMLAAALAALRDDGETLSVGAPNALEGAIVVAARPLDGAAQRLAADAVRGSPGPVARRRSTSSREDDRPDGMLLRLGSSGLGSLTQQQTLDLLADSQEESVIVLPVGSRIGREWAEVAREDGLTVLLAFGDQVRAELTVTRVVSSGRDTPVAETGAWRNPWPMDEAPCWFVADRVGFLDASTDDYLFWHASRWERGFTGSQSAWIRFRYPGSLDVGAAPR